MTEKMEITKTWDPKYGFSKEEARLEKAKLDAMYGTSDADSKWAPAVVTIDPSKMGGGYKVVVKPKA